MAGEIRLTWQVQIQGNANNNAGQLNYAPAPVQQVMNASAAIANGAIGGAILAKATGTDIDLSKVIALGGFCRIKNLDSVNTLVVGVYDPTSNLFYPLLDFLPGEEYPMRLSQFLLEDFSGTGSLIGLTNKTFHAKGMGGDVWMDLNIFNK